MPVSKAKAAANARWDAANLRRMSLAIPIDLYNRLKQHTDDSGETINGFIRRAIETALNDRQGSGN